MIIITILAFIVIFSLLILVHEWGHFAAARKSGIRVEEFGIGLPPRAFVLHKDKNGTVYSLNWIPFGGYVRLFGEDAKDTSLTDDPESFSNKTILQRAIVVVSGVMMNFVLAWILVTIGFTFGMKPFLITEQDIQSASEIGLVETRKALYVHEVTPDLPAEMAGIKKGDVILELNGKPAISADDFSSEIHLGVNQLLLNRDGKENLLEISSNAQRLLGVIISTESLITKINNIKYPFYVAPFKAITQIGRLSVLTVKMLGHVVFTLVQKFAIPEGVAGPVGIAKMTHAFIKEGFMAILQFTALISISLGVLNIMPFPALDGGRLLFIIFELVLRRRPSPKWESAIHAFGFGILMLLIFAVTWNDIIHLMK